MERKISFSYFQTEWVYKPDKKTASIASSRDRIPEGGRTENAGAVPGNLCDLQQLYLSLHFWKRRRLV